MENHPWLFLKRCHEGNRARMKKKTPAPNINFLPEAMPLHSRFHSNLMDNIFTKCIFQKGRNPVIVISNDFQAVSRSPWIGPLIICLQTLQYLLRPVCQVLNQSESISQTIILIKGMF